LVDAPHEERAFGPRERDARARAFAVGTRLPQQLEGVARELLRAARIPLAQMPGEGRHHVEPLAPARGGEAALEPLEVTAGRVELHGGPFSRAGRSRSRRARTPPPSPPGPSSARPAPTGCASRRSRARPG